MNSPVGRSYPKRGQRIAASYTSTRRPRRSAGIPPTQAQTATRSGPSEKWAKVLRHPVSPLDEPYFGSSPTATFKVLTWVKVCDLTEEEKVIYDEAEKQKERQRSAWKEAVEERRVNEVAQGANADEIKTKDTCDDSHRDDDDDNSAQVHLDGIGSGEKVENIENPMRETIDHNDNSGLATEMEISQSDAQDEPMTTETIVSDLNNNEQGREVYDSEPSRKKQKLTDEKAESEQSSAE